MEINTAYAQQVNNHIYFQSNGDKPITHIQTPEGILIPIEKALQIWKNHKDFLLFNCDPQSNTQKALVLDVKIEEKKVITAEYEGGIYAEPIEEITKVVLLNTSKAKVYEKLTNHCSLTELCIKNLAKVCKEKDLTPLLPEELIVLLKNEIMHKLDLDYMKILIAQSNNANSNLESKAKLETLINNGFPVTNIINISLKSLLEPKPQVEPVPEPKQKKPFFHIKMKLPKFFKSSRAS